MFHFHVSQGAFQNPRCNPLPRRPMMMMMMMRRRRRRRRLGACQEASIRIGWPTQVLTLQSKRCPSTYHFLQPLNPSQLATLGPEDSSRSVPRGLVLRGSGRRVRENWIRCARSRPPWRLRPRPPAPRPRWRGNASARRTRGNGRIQQGMGLRQRWPGVRRS